VQTLTITIQTFTLKKKTMKHFFKLTCAASILTAGIITLSSFKPVAKKTTVDSYVINLESKIQDGSNYVWTWTLQNPNPGNGDNGTLQDVSHWDIPLSLQAEAALISAEYSLDGGITWMSVTPEMDRDPSVRLCCLYDVLKFNVGTSGTNVNTYRLIFSEDFEENPNATSIIKTGGGLKGCNWYVYTGVGAQRQD